MISPFFLHAMSGFSQCGKVPTGHHLACPMHRPLLDGVAVFTV